MSGRKKDRGPRLSDADRQAVQAVVAGSFYRGAATVHDTAVPKLMLDLEPVLAGLLARERDQVAAPADDQAVALVVAYVRAQQEQRSTPFSEWLAYVLARVAAELGSSGQLIADRPGSWESDLVNRLVKGTVGWGDEYLSDYRGS